MFSFKVIIDNKSRSNQLKSKYEQLKIRNPFQLNHVESNRAHKEQNNFIKMVQNAHLGCFHPTMEHNAMLAPRGDQLILQPPEQPFINDLNGHHPTHHNHISYNGHQKKFSMTFLF